MPAYYIRFDSFWDNGPDRYCGPFATRNEAEAEIERAVHAVGGKVVRSGNDPETIKNAVRVLGVVTKTQAGHNLNPDMVFDRLPRNLSELREAEMFMKDNL